MRSDTLFCQIKNRIALLYIILLIANVLVWLWALVVFHNNSVHLGAAFLAYTFGLRHAVDADHIAAIDNVTRKLMNEGKKPVAVGLFFSLGHSTVVFALSIILATTVASLQRYFPGIKETGGVIGTSVSAFFLFFIAMANVFVLISICKKFRGIISGKIVDELDVITLGGGLISRGCHRLFGLISHSWHMYPLGFLFGLGVDTATEVGLLGISASQAPQGMSVWTILIFPALFTAGMTLVDSIDSTLMLGVYQWAIVKPLRKLYYNIIITLVSILIAFLVGSIEVLGLLSDEKGSEGPFWRIVALLNDNFEYFGFIIIALFALCWLISIIIYRAKGYDDMEVCIDKTLS